VDKGVLVVMNDEVHAATYVTKTHTTNVATFQTPTFGPLGLVSKSEVIYFQKFLHHEYYPIKELVDKVYLLKAYAGMDSMLFDAIADSDANGLVIEALGAGNLPPTTLPGLQRCLDKGIPVVLVSRAFNGVTYDVYNYSGGGKQLREAGVIFTTGLSGQKARVKLSVLLSAHANREIIIRAFQV
jgi:L-asparaginase